MTMNIESKLEMSGDSTPEEASLLVNRVPQRVYDEVKVTYEEEGEKWGIEDLPAKEAEEYLESAAASESSELSNLPELSVQPAEKMDEKRYFTEAPEDVQEEFYKTQLPNPREMSLEGDIEASAGYDDGFLWLDVEAEGLKRGDSTEGTLKIEYSDRFETDSENELQRTQEALGHFDGLGPLLDQNSP